jgi:hypothetical protein
MELKRRVVLLAMIGAGGCTEILGESETVYVLARVVDDQPEEDEITSYRDEQVQANEFARELVPEAVRSGGSAERRAGDAGRDAISDLPTTYISYQDHIVGMFLRTLE